MLELPFNVVENKISYIELEELTKLDYTTISFIFGFSKATGFFKAVQENRGALVYDINRYLQTRRTVINKDKACPFIGLSSIQHNRDIVLERMLRKMNISALLKYPPVVIHALLNDCPFYTFEGSPMKYYRRLELHYTIYRMSIYNKEMSDSLNSAVSFGEISQKITKEADFNKEKGLP
jgi:hypothetical protein